jgi:probable F420-dependent oxidoreductase
MEFGLSLGDVASVVADARRAEELGFGYLACGEHLFFHVAPNPFVELAAAAAVTERIRLVSSINLLPLYPAAMVAKLAATLDQVSRGRFVLGVGAGGEAPAEFAAVGVDVGSRFRRLDEGLEIVRALFTGQPVTYSGQFAQLEGVRLDPPPVQPGGPPIWLGGRRAASIRRAGRFAQAWMPYMITPESFRSGLRETRDAAADRGRDPLGVHGALLAFACADRDANWAHREGVKAVSATYQQDFTTLADRYLLLGSPAQVVERIRQYQESGVKVLVLQIAAEPGDRDRVIRTIADEVLPEFG